jgi:hypothetical protein
MVALPAPSLGAAPGESRTELSLDSRTGQSTAPYLTRAFPRASGYGVSLVAAGRYPISPQIQVGLRVPLVLMRVEQPAGALYAEAAWGNPELSTVFWQPLLERRGWSLRLGAGLAVAAPLAEHDPAQLAGRALRLANAFEGWSEPALFTPGVLPMTPAGSLTLENERWKLLASVALPLLFRLSDADLPPESRQRPVGLSTVSTLEVQWRAARWLTLVAAPRLTVQAVSAAEDHASVVQLLAAGRADATLGHQVVLSALLQAPLGGPLGGSTVAGGLRLATLF